MPPKGRLRKAAMWAGIAVPLLVLLNIAAYYRVVGKTHIFKAVRDKHGTPRIYRESQAVYSLPWPVPSHFNHPWLLQKMQVWFEPVHQLDRRLRIDVWKDEPPLPLPASPPPNWMDQFDRPSFDPDKLPSP